jgi:hypothetical protein
MQVHQAYAIKLLFENEFRYKQYNISNLNIMTSIRKITSPQISRFGILEVISENDFAFVHRTFAEFLVVRFLIDNFEAFDLTKPETDSDLKIYMLNSVFSCEHFFNTKEDLLNYLKIKNEAPTFFEVLENEQEFFAALRSFSSFLNLKQFFGNMGHDGIVNVLNYFHELKNEIDLNFQKDPNIKNFILTKLDENLSVFHRLFQYAIFEKNTAIFLEKIPSILSKSEISNLLFLQGAGGLETTLMLVSRFKKLKYVNLFWNFLNKTLDEDEIIKLLLIEQKGSFTALHYSTLNYDPKSFLFMKEIYEKYLSQEKIQNIFMKIHKDYPSFLFEVIQHASLETIREVSKYFEKLFESKKVELRKILSFRNYLGNTFFYWFKNRSGSSEKLLVFTELLRKTFDENQGEEFEEHLKNLELNLNFFSDFSKQSPNLQNFHKMRMSEWSQGDFEFYNTNFDEIKQNLGV